MGHVVIQQCYRYITTDYQVSAPDYSGVDNMKKIHVVGILYTIVSQVTHCFHSIIISDDLFSSLLY